MLPVSSTVNALLLHKTLGSPGPYMEKEDAANPVDITPTFLSVLYCEEVKAKHRTLNSNKIPPFSLWSECILYSH